MAQEKTRVGIIGHTGRGNYGHGLDVCWKDIPEVEIAGVADADPKGLADATQRLGGVQGFADYKAMIEETKPTVIAICQRHVDQHLEMFLAAAERGVKGVYMEKPLCRSLAEADQMIAASEKYNVKLAQAHLTRYAPALDIVKNLIMDGKLGTLLEFRGRGKEDARGGCEDFWVLGSHMLNVMHFLGGDPDWVFARVEQDGRPVTKADLKEGNEGLGLMGGNAVNAMYGFDNGVKGFWSSVKGVGAGGGATRFGLQIFGSKGVIDLKEGYAPPLLLLENAGWCEPLVPNSKWVPITSAGIGKPETITANWRAAGNIVAARDLVAAVRDNRAPECDLQQGRWILEMISGAYESARVGAPVSLPLKTRVNPFTLYA